MKEIQKKLLKALGFEDYRAFIMAFGNWADRTDFTYSSSRYERSFKTLLNAFIKDLKSE